MKMKDNDIYAFPVGDGSPRLGMTLRDYFAGQALVVLADPTVQTPPNDLATYVYSVADAMLKERAK